ncbi:phage tail domain-containing protein [Alkalihalobacillus sp. BA299]|uniref:phage distal tail protein n=1 Tax=Alkalihalobacillus sp. BA299 TaxID=2815938 RepID=UPI001ADA25E6|nr:phage tail domain-containing protein [Alkalihalobacillus sp. BA299]
MADKIYWIDSNGNEQQLSLHPNFSVLKGMNGRFMPPISFVEDEVPFQHGSRLRNVKVKARDVDIPLLIQADSEVNLRRKVRESLRMFNPLNGDGKLKSIAPDGSQRELTCRYSMGFEGLEDSDNKGYTWQTLVLVFRAFDPYWYDTSTNVKTFNTGETATFFPFFPLRLSSSTVFTDTTIDNQGDVEAWPEWIIKGPGENIYLRNLTTGQLLNLNISLAVGETATIVTKPFEKSIKKNDGTNLYGEQSEESSLWALREGKNNIRIEMSNATENSSVQLSYKNRYLGA